MEHPQREDKHLAQSQKEDKQWRTHRGKTNMVARIEDKQWGTPRGRTDTGTCLEGAQTLAHPRGNIDTNAPPEGGQTLAHSQRDDEHWLISQRGNTNTITEIAITRTFKGKMVTFLAKFSEGAPPHNY